MFLCFPLLAAFSGLKRMRFFLCFSIFFVLLESTVIRVHRKCYWYRFSCLLSQQLLGLCNLGCSFLPSCFLKVIACRQCVPNNIWRLNSHLADWGNLRADRHAFSFFPPLSLRAHTSWIAGFPKFIALSLRALFAASLFICHFSAGRLRIMPRRGLGKWFLLLLQTDNEEGHIS